MSTKTVHTFCRYCMASYGIEVTVDDNRVLKISADRQNPYTWKDFCAKGRTANQAVVSIQSAATARAGPHGCPDCRR